ncbi:hypothetical protein V6N13_101223 [Hibiscus sabdariffa]
MKACLGFHMMKRITSATPAFILPSTGNSLPFSLSKLRITCFRSVNSTASDENDNMGRCEEATSLLSTMVTEHIVPDIRTFNILLDAVIKQGTNDKGLEVLMVMDQHGVKPNALTYRTMIRMYSYKMLINGYAKSKRKVDTVRLAEEMLQKGLTVDLETHTLLRGAIKGPEMIKVLEKGRQREAKRIQLGLNQDIIWLIFFGISGGSISSKLKGCQLQICQSSPFFRKPRLSKMLFHIQDDLVLANELLLKRRDLHTNRDKISSISKKRPRISKDASKVDKNAH